MHGNDQFGPEHMSCFRGIGWTHGEVVADGEQRDVDCFQATQQRHVTEQSGIPGMIDCLSVKIDDKTAGVPSGYAGTMKSRCNSDEAEVEIMFAAQVHSMGRDSFFRASPGDFGRRYDRGACAFRNFYCIAQVVVVPM